MKLEIEVRGDFKLVYFELSDEEDRHEIAATVEGMRSSLVGPETVLLRGDRRWSWVYVMIGHAAHACPNLATYQEEVDGYLVSTRHGGRWAAGDEIPSSTVPMTVEGGHIIDR